MLGIFKSKVGAAAKKMSGRTDALQATCAAIAWMAAADGTITDAEIEKGVATVENNPNLKDAFKQSDIHREAERCFKLAQGGRVGIMSLKREIGDVKGQDEIAEAVLLSALDVAETPDEGETIGSINEAEKKIAIEIGKLLDLDALKFI